MAGRILIAVELPQYLRAFLAEANGFHSDGIRLGKRGQSLILRYPISENPPRARNNGINTPQLLAASVSDAEELEEQALAPAGWSACKTKKLVGKAACVLLWQNCCISPGRAMSANMNTTTPGCVLGEHFISRSSSVFQLTVAIPRNRDFASILFHLIVSHYTFRGNANTSILSDDVDMADNQALSPQRPSS